MKHILLINGPPRSGKDTLADIICQISPVKAKKMKFANVLKVDTHLHFNTPKLAADAYESQKDVPMEVFDGMSPREAYIWYSEDVIKPKYGNEYFGKKLFQEINRPVYKNIKLFVISDSGFSEEAEALFDMPGFNYSLVRLERDGTNFDNDSRSYWVEEHDYVYKIANNGNVLELAEKGISLLKTVLDFHPNLW